MGAESSGIGGALDPHAGTQSFRVAKLATLEQAARVGAVPLPELITMLRRELGQEGGAPVAEAASSVLAAWPPWFRAGAVVAELDFSKILAEGGHPLGLVRQALNAHPPGAIVVLTSDFELAPLLAQVGQEGLLAACIREGSNYRTALRRP